MNDIEESADPIYIGTFVACFLLVTGRALKAIEVCKECLILLNTKAAGKGKEFGKNVYAEIYSTMFSACCVIPDYTNALQYGRELLVIFRDSGETAKEENVTTILADMYKRQCKYTEARELYHKAMNITNETGDIKGQAYACRQLGEMSYYLGECVKAREYTERALALSINIGDRGEEAICYGNLGAVFKSFGEYDKSKEYLDRAIAIKNEIGNRAGEADDYLNLSTVFQCLGEYDKAKKHCEQAFAIIIDIGDRSGEATCYGKLGNVFQCLGEYNNAKEYYEKALEIRSEIGDRVGEAADLNNLGTVFQSLGEYEKSKEYHEKALAISIGIGIRSEEASCYGNLGTVFQSLSEYGRARECHEKALEISIEIGDRAKEAADYANLGTVLESLGEYDEAKEYLEKALAISIDIDDRAKEATCYGNIGTVFQRLGEYGRAQEYHTKALEIKIEIGDRAGEATCYGNLGNVFILLGEHEKAKEYVEKALAISINIGHKEGEAVNYDKLGTVFKSLGKYGKAKKYLQKALEIRIEIGDREGEADSNEELGIVLKHLGEYEKAKECYTKALQITMEIGHRENEASKYGNLGTLFNSLGEHITAEEYLEKALLISQEIGDPVNELKCYCSLTMVKLCQGKMQEAYDYLILSVNKSEDLRGFLENNDEFKIAFSDVHDFPYRSLCSFFCLTGNPYDALYVLELARGRALADLMLTQYSVESETTANPQSWIGIEDIIKKESNCACLYISYHDQEMFLWILKPSRVNCFRKIAINETVIGSRLVSSLHDFLSKSFRSLGISSQLDCEDRSLNSIEWEQELSQEEKLADLRLFEEDDGDNQDPEPSLPLLYKMIIDPVAAFLEESEIIIVPDRSLYQVPFAALSDEGGKYLSETYRIRIVPSLSTLKLIQDSPADYHSQTGALIVGDPVVGWVRYKKYIENFKPLPCARKEAEMVGRLLGVEPLLGQHATKKAVLQGINSVSLIHFAAHGNAQRGEIALSPVRYAAEIPPEEDFLLTMSDISNVRLRAKLVVLSCCHSGCGQIKAEGVVGIARAFLGSGARSVLVALWAIEDKATEQLISRFYEHLLRGESASESLHEAMKWMRGNGFTEVSQWAPFMLIGDNVKFDFGKEKN